MFELMSMAWPFWHEARNSRFHSLCRYIGQGVPAVRQGVRGACGAWHASVAGAAERGHRRAREDRGTHMGGKQLNGALSVVDSTPSSAPPPAFLAAPASRARFLPKSPAASHPANVSHMPRALPAHPKFSILSDSSVRKYITLRVTPSGSG